MEEVSKVGRLMKEIFKKLSIVNLTKKVKQVPGKPTYIEWTEQWATLLEYYPLSTYEVHEDKDGNPFTISPLGIFVKISVTIEGLTRTLNHPVLNSINKSMKLEAYEYNTKTGKRTVEAASTFDINTAIFRGLTKCIALFGLGLYIYKGDLVPAVELLESKQLQEVMNTINEKNLKLSEVCQDWQVEKIAMIWASNFDALITYLKGK